MMGGVSFGTNPEEDAAGVGMVKWTTCSGLRMWFDAIQAPEALILSVFVNSTNSTPDASCPRKKMGTWRRILGNRRCFPFSTCGVVFAI